MAINVNRRLILLLSLTCGWLTLIYILSSRPTPEIMTKIEGLDKLAHLAVYGILGLLIYGILEQMYKQKRISTLLKTLLLVLGAGILDEIHQLSTPGRNFSLFDLATDIIGSTSAILIFNFFASIKKRV